MKGILQIRAPSIEEKVANSSLNDRLVFQIQQDGNAVIICSVKKSILSLFN